MSTIKSSAENLVLNADGSNNDIIFQSNGSNIATLDQAGTLTATTFVGALTGSASASLPLAGGTMTGNIVMSDDTSIGISDSDERIEFDGAGDISVLGANFGIGTTSPSVEMSIAGSDPQLVLWEGADGSSSSKVQLGTGAAQGFINIHKGDGTRTIQLSSDGDTYFNGGKVGIGVTPESGLHLSDGTNVTTPQNTGRTSTLIIEGGAETADLQFLTSQNYSHIFFGDAADPNVGTLLYDHTNNSMQFVTNASERMRIDSSGEVLIGTTAQGRETNLAVVGTDQSPTGAWSQFGIYSSDSYAINKGGSLMFGGQDGATSRQFFSAIKGAKENATSGNYAGYMAFYTRPSGAVPVERMRMDSSGNVGIGTSDISTSHGYDKQLQLEGASNAHLVIAGGANEFGLAYNGGALLRNYANSKMNFFTNNAERMQITANGKVLIGRSSANSTEALQISHTGASQYGLYLNSTDSGSGTHYHMSVARGDSQCGYMVSGTTTISLVNSSDERLKENIQDSASAIQDLKDMKVRQFDWKNDRDVHRDYGFVAQELITVVPEAVTQGSEELKADGTPVQSWGVDDSKIIPRLVKAMQEQQVTIEALTARITTLENA